MIKKIGVLLVFLPILLMVVTGCYNRVEIPPAHKGKILSVDGFQEGVIPVGKVKLNAFCLSCPSLVLVEAPDYVARENLEIYMPQDDLTLTLPISGTYTISDEDDNINQIFAKLTAEEVEKKDGPVISIQKVYNTYAKNIVRETARSHLTGLSYTDSEGNVIRGDINYIMENQELVRKQLFTKIRDNLSTTPIQIKILAFDDLQPPPLIKQAQEEAAKREVEISQARAQKLVDIEKAEAQREVALKRQEIDLIEAETQVLVEQKLADAVSVPWQKQRELRAMQTLFENASSVVVFPSSMLESVGGQTALSMEVLKMSGDSLNDEEVVDTVEEDN